MDVTARTVLRSFDSILQQCYAEEVGTRLAGGYPHRNLDIAGCIDRRTHRDAHLGPGRLILLDGIDDIGSTH